MPEGTINASSDSTDENVNPGVDEQNIDSSEPIVGGQSDTEALLADEVAATDRVLEHRQADPVITKPKRNRGKLLLIAGTSFAVIVVLVAGWFVFLKKGSVSDNNPQSTRIEEVKRLGVAPGLVEGTVEYSSDKGATWQKLEENVSLSEGDQVRTLADGRVVLLIDDGSATRLGVNSSLELTDLRTNSVVITNISGETYNRVLPSDSRQYSVVSNDQAYTAKGTAFRTFNSDTKKGVEVFHSTVGVDEKETDVTEGNAFFTLNEQKEKENTVSAIDLAALKKDDFIKWNSEQDKKNAEFANALGVLVELDKPDPAPAPAPQSASQSSGITLSGSVSEYSANFSWKVSGVDVSKGYKLVKSKSSQSPTYPESSAAFIESGKTSYSLYLGDGKTYYFRICAYRGDSCDSYSNTVTITTPVKPKVAVTGNVTGLTLSGSSISWGFDGTAPNGFKVVGKKGATPSYEDNDFVEFTSSTSHNLPDSLDSGEYKIRVCKYDDGGCVGYSNEISYLVP